MAISVGSVVIDCNDFESMRVFWQEALHYTFRHISENDWVILRDPQERHVNVALQKVPEQRVGKNRLHFDLYADDWHFRQAAPSEGAVR